MDALLQRLTNNRYKESLVWPVKLNPVVTTEKLNIDLSVHPNSSSLILSVWATCRRAVTFLFDRLDISVCLSANVQLRSLRLACLWTLNIMLVSERGDKMPVLASVAASDCIVRVGALALNSWPPSLWPTVFPQLQVLYSQ